MSGTCFECVWLCVEREKKIERRNGPFGSFESRDSDVKGEGKRIISINKLDFEKKMNFSKKRESKKSNVENVGSDRQDRSIPTRKEKVNGRSRSKNLILNVFFENLSVYDSV